MGFNPSVPHALPTGDVRQQARSALHRHDSCQWRREIPQNRRAEIPRFILI